MFKKIVVLALSLFLILTTSAYAELLMWDAISDTEVIQVDVYERADGTPTYGSATYTQADMTKNYVVLTKGTPGIRYHWVATASSLDEESEQSAEVSWIFATTGGGTSVPGAPTSIGIINCEVLSSGDTGYDECVEAGQQTQ